MRACAPVPESGQSRSVTPRRSRTTRASSFTSMGSVLVSITIFARPFDCAISRATFTSACAVGSDVMRIGARRARSRTSFALVPPARSKSLRRFATMSKPTVSMPAAIRLADMADPMMPRPARRRCAGHASASQSRHDGSEEPLRSRPRMSRTMKTMRETGSRRARLERHGRMEGAARPGSARSGLALHVDDAFHAQHVRAAKARSTCSTVERVPREGSSKVSRTTRSALMRVHGDIAGERAPAPCPAPRRSQRASARSRPRTPRPGAARCRRATPDRARRSPP